MLDDWLRFTGDIAKRIQSKDITDFQSHGNDFKSRKYLFEVAIALKLLTKDL